MLYFGNEYMKSVHFPCLKNICILYLHLHYKEIILNENAGKCTQSYKITLNV
jgi:hypothetical protein